MKAALVSPDGKEDIGLIDLGTMNDTEWAKWCKVEA